MVSCSSNEDPKPSKPSKEDLVGTWTGEWASSLSIYIANDGDLRRSFYPYALIGKVADTFDSYPYTIKLITTNVEAKKSRDGGTITFYSATNFVYIYSSGDKESYSHYSDKLIVENKEVDKNRIWNF